MDTGFTTEYLMKHSNLPGPRGNLELLNQFIHEASPQEIQTCLSFYSEELTNSPEEFVAMCGTSASIYHSLCQRASIETDVSIHVNSADWRIREGICIGLQNAAQTLGTAVIMDKINPWASGTPYEMRAVAATLCEPALLKEEAIAAKTLAVLRLITETFFYREDKLTEAEITLRKTLGYGWSVAIVALPESGKRQFESLLDVSGKHIKWIVKENLKKNRLVKMDSKWVESLSRRLDKK